MAEKLTIPDVVPQSTPRLGGIVQAFGGKDEGTPSPPYAALLQARSAVLALDRAYKATAIGASKSLATTAVFVPMVVVDGVLLESGLEAELSERLRVVDALVASIPGDLESEAAMVPV